VQKKKRTFTHHGVKALNYSLGASTPSIALLICLHAYAMPKVEPNPDDPDDKGNSKIRRWVRVTGRFLKAAAEFLKAVSAFF
jgi:ribosomal protein L16 Arg81 hydroxylase